MSKIVLVATPYCYGPTTKLLCVAKRLRSRHELIYVGNTPGIELAQLADFSTTIAVDDRNDWNQRALSALRDGDLMVSFLEYKALALAAKMKVPAIFVDTLAWLRDVPPVNNETAIAYVSQRFLTALNKALFLPQTPLYEIGAILPAGELREFSRNRDSAKRRRLLVNLGGLHSPNMMAGADYKFAQWVIDLLNSCEHSGWDVILALPLYMEASASFKSALVVQVHFFGHTEFIAELEASAALLTVPGLESVLEALELKVPIAFLPPHNGSQFRQLAAYLANQIPIATLRSPVPNQLCLPQDLATLTEHIQAANSKAFDDPEYMTQSERIVRDFLITIASDETTVLNHVSRGSQVLRNIGTDGASEMEEIIETALAK